MNVSTMIEAMRAGRRGELGGVGRLTRPNPARERVDGVMRFNGSGGSGHTGTVRAQPLRGDRSKVRRLKGMGSAGCHR